MIAERNPYVRDAVNTLYRLSEDPEVRAQMEYREKARRDHATLLYAAFREGEARSRVEIARNMKSLGLLLEVAGRHPLSFIRMIFRRSLIASVLGPLPSSFSILIIYHIFFIRLVRQLH